MEQEEVKAGGSGLQEMSAGPLELGAANEIRKFRRMFKAVFEIGEKLENVALLDQALAERRKKIGGLQSEQEVTLGAILEKIHSAEKTLNDLQTSAVAEHEAKVASLKAEREEIRAVLDAEIEVARAERDTLLESVQGLKEEVKKKGDELYTVETRLRQIREKFAE